MDMLEDDVVTGTLRSHQAELHTRQAEEEAGEGDSAWGTDVSIGWSSKIGEWS